MDQTNHVPLKSNEFTQEVLDGATIYGADGERIGSVSHVVGSLIVVDVGGLLGIGAKPVAVPGTQLEFMRDESGDVHAVTPWTMAELEDMPAHQD